MRKITIEVYKNTFGTTLYSLKHPSASSTFTRYSKYLCRWNSKLNVLYPYLSIHIRKSLPNIHRYGTPKLRFSESRFSEQKPAPLIVFYTIHCLSLVKFSV